MHESWGVICRNESFLLAKCYTQDELLLEANVGVGNNFNPSVVNHSIKLVDVERYSELKNKLVILFALN